MTTVTITTDQSTEESTHSVHISADETASGAPALRRRTAPLFVPLDQAYYWTSDWQADEAAALREIAEGKARRFATGAEAAEWLLSDDDA